MTKIFISWSGKWGKDIAIFLKDHMFALPNYDRWVSFRDIEKGAEWYSQTIKSLESAEVGIFCFTPGTSTSPWFNFESGFIAGKLNKIYTIQFGDQEIYKPLERYQTTKANQKDDWVNLISQITNDRTFSQNWVNDRYPKLTELLEKSKLPPYKYFNDLNQTVVNLCKSSDSLNEKNEFMMENICFQKVILTSFEELQHRTEKINNSYSIPSYYYAPYLVSLQEDVHVKPVVKAIALVDIEEQFWQQPVGRAILRTSNKQSIRIFAFNSEKDFNRFYEILKLHSLHYIVLAISNKNLLDILGNYYARDFSIIRSSVDGSRLLSLYEDTDNNLIHKDICFSCDLDAIEKHEDKFNQILKYAINISSTADEIEDLSKRIFQSLTTYSKKPIEMSAYIDISDYDQHEEEHAYYQEMMQYMIDVSIRHSKQLKQESVRVLELGAGTGIFTVRIINQIKNLSQLDIIEIDWHCFHILKHKIRQSFPINNIISEHADKLEINITHNNRTSRINVYHKDSREYDPEGQFDYVFSSFADHHIRSSDKQKYFTNAKNNIYDDGLFIVGDEFLRRYDSNDKQDRELALRNYHDHIIEIATNEGHYILARLEELALDSGLKETGDFKVSCQGYETHLERSGFIFEQPKKIGPLDLDGIGGVYVYQCRLKR